MSTILYNYREHEHSSIYNKPNSYDTTHNNSVNLLDNFENGLNREKLKRIELRKDAVILLNLKQKYDLISKNTSPRNKIPRSQHIPYYKLRDGRNLFELSKKQLNNLFDIYELNFKELDKVKFDYLAALPNLSKLFLRFSNVSFKKDFDNHNFIPFNSLSYLDLSCCNLKNDVLDYLVHLKPLKYLNLMGNCLTGDIGDLSNLSNLEELNLCHNQIESKFLNTQIKNIMQAKTNPQTSNQSLNLPETSILPESFISSLNNNQIKEDSKVLSEEEWQKYLKTNLQVFFHNLSKLPNLKNLNLSFNKINFFDINPYYVQNTSGFNNLEILDLSYNSLEEEIAIILVVNVKNLKLLDLTGNPIIANIKAYENIEYEIFKNKGIFIVNSEDVKNNKSKKKKVIDVEAKKLYKIKKYKVASTAEFAKSVKNKVKAMTDGPEPLETIESNLFETMKSNNKNDVFITGRTGDLTKSNSVNKYSVKEMKHTTYDEFLKTAHNVFGKSIHYKNKEVIPIAKAYHKLRHVINNAKASNKEENDNDYNYLKNTISNTIRNEEYIPNKNNFRNGKILFFNTLEFKILNQINKNYSQTSLHISQEDFKDD